VTFLWSGFFLVCFVINSVPASFFHYSIFCCTLMFCHRRFDFSRKSNTFSPLAPSSKCQYKSPLLLLSNWFFVLNILLLFVLLYACFLLSLPTGVLQLEGHFLFHLTFVSDFFSTRFNLILFSISLSVLVWSYYYMDTDDSYTLLFFLISLFIFSMSILIISGSLLSFFIGWDLLGFTSLFLIF
jgi:NADH:ubiquinone oxidoreductase subunit 5 (subunit L)/multisubunit Na+/H+ antiporter MnhA subunit